MKIEDQRINGKRMRPVKARRNGGIVTCVTACVVGVLVAACGTGPGQVTVPDGAEPSPPGAAIQHPTAPPSPPLDMSCHPLESLRPSGPLPSPGHMPAGSTMATIQNHHRLIVGVDQTIYLDSYRDPLDGQLTGFDIDIARQIAKAIFGNPNRIEFKAITSAQRIPVILSGQVDLVIDSMDITCDRLKSVDFSTDYFNAGQQVLVPADSTARGIGDLGGKKVCAAAGTVSIQEIELQPSHPVPVAAPNWTDCLVMLQQNQVAAISTDNSLLAGIAVQDPQTKIVGPVFTFEPHGVGISKKAPDLVRFVNAVLEQMRTDGMWTDLYMKWYGSRMGPVPAPPAPSYSG
jgi:polar amino acid transport system substrate-binding protein